MMKNGSDIDEYIQALVQAKGLQSQVVYQHVIPESVAAWDDLENPFPGEVAEVMRALGVPRLYRHQAKSIDLVRSDRHVVVATPTASGKTLVYNLPLLVMADRNDLGGISTPYHPQTTQAAVFIYDGIPGGAGLSRQAFQRAADLLAYTRKAIQSCPCETGCPSCGHSPKCGSGNRPIDKAAAVFLLERLRHGGRRPERRKAITVKW